MCPASAIRTAVPSTRRRRAVAALRYPLVDVLTHPTGRIVGGRVGGGIAKETRCVEAVRAGTALEINGDPNRLDLRDVHARAAAASGCMPAVGSDAHATDGLENMYDGVG